MVLEDTSCRVYAAPGNATKGELICIPTDLVLDHYTYDLTEDIEHFAACRPSYQMTACTNVNNLHMYLFKLIFVICLKIDVTASLFLKILASEKSSFSTTRWIE